MKNLIFRIAPFLIGFGVFAQESDRERKITVEGSARVEVNPDIVVLSIAVSEYKEEKLLVTLDEIEKRIEAVLAKCSIPDSCLARREGFSQKIYKVKESKEKIVNRARYYLKLYDIDQVDPFVTNLTTIKEKVLRVSSVQHSRIDSIKAEVRSMAILDARRHAQDILSPLNKKVGDPLTISVSNSSTHNIYGVSRRYGSYSGTETSDKFYGYKGELSLDNLTLSESVNATFKISDE